jgi:methionine aminotransferase
MPNYPNAIQSKLPKVETTIFTVMSRLATEHGAVNLSQGFPDFAVSPKLISLVTENMNKGHNQYAPMPGLMALRESIAKKVEGLYSAQYDPETEITITAGGTQALFTAISAWVKEGDEVIIIEPAYDSYAPAVELCGGRPVYAQLSYPDFTINWDGVKKLVNRNTRMIIINTPHNPTGSVLTAADMDKLEKLTRNSDIVILSDEVYEHIIFDGLEHQSVARYPKLAERSFIVSSFGKTIHATGWKIGYCMAPKNLMAEFRKAHQYNVFAVNTPMQYALAEYIQDKSTYLELADFYKKKRDVFNNLFGGTRFKLKASQGTYFQLLDYSAITDEKDTDLAIRLTKEFGVASIPISVFYHKPQDNKVLRFCFAKGEDTLEKAAEKLRKFA